MAFFSKFKKTAKEMPLPMWLVALLVPGGMTAIIAYMAWKASKKDKPKQTMNEFIKDMINSPEFAEEIKKEKDDRSKDCT